MAGCRSALLLAYRACRVTGLAFGFIPNLQSRADAGLVGIAVTLQAPSGGGTHTLPL